MGTGSLGKSAEKRMRDIRLGAEFRVELTGHIPRMAGNLDEFDQISLGVDPADPQPCFLQGGPMGVVELVTVTVALPDLRSPIGLLSEGTGSQLAGVISQPHGGTLVSIDVLAREEGNHRLRCGWVKL